MKNIKFITIFVIASVLVFGSCYVYVKKELVRSKGGAVVIKDERPEEGEAIKIDNFQKKIECQKFIDSVSKKINLFNGKQKPEIRDSNNSGGEPINHSYIESKEFKEVFYSPKVDSCLDLEVARTSLKVDNMDSKQYGQWATSYEDYNLIDILSGKQIDSVSTINRSEVMNSYDDKGNISNYVYKDVDKMLEEYKKD